MDSSPIVAISSPPPIPPRKSSPMSTPKHRINKILKPESNIMDSAIIDHSQAMIIQQNTGNNSVQTMVLEQHDQPNEIASQSSCYQPKNGYPFFTDDGSVDTWPSWPSNC